VPRRAVDKLDFLSGFVKEKESFLSAHLESSDLESIAELRFPMGINSAFLKRR
jgi:hypothetical protein